MRTAQAAVTNRLKQPPHAKGRKFCIFCGAPANSEEHNWPKWAASILPDSLGYRQFVLKGKRASAEVRVHKNYDRQGPTRNVRIKRVCRDCNSTWMSGLETQVRPILAPLILGETRILHRQDMQLLAYYLTMKLMVLDWVDGDPVLSMQHGREFHEKKAAPPNLIMTIFNCFEGDWRSAFRAHFMPIAYAKDFVSTDEPPNTKSFSIGFGNLFVFAYVSTTVDLAPEFDPERAIRLFPTDRRVVIWPPRYPIESREAEFVATSLDRLGTDNDGLKVVNL